MKDWKTLQPDVIKLLNKHFTPGRNGNKIDKVVIHHNAGVLSIDQIWQVWQDRPASAHYQVETGGRIGQLVWDRDTAWHAANSWVNQTSLGIEFANSSGASADWPISSNTIEEGAHLVAAICHYYKLGRPQAGANVRFHREFTSTSCPHHLAPGGKYYDTLMSRAKFWYDNPDGTPKNIPSTTPTIQEDDMSFTDEDRKMLRTVYSELTKKFPSRSAYRTSDELVDTLAGFVLNVDGRQHEEAVGNAVKATGLTAEQVVEKLREGKNFAEIREEAHDA